MLTLAIVGAAIFVLGWLAALINMGLIIKGTGRPIVHLICMGVIFIGGIMDFAALLWWAIAWLERH